MQITFILDVLKPHQPGNALLARFLVKLPGAKSVRIKVDEIDSKTTSIFITIKGGDELSLEIIERTLEENNCSLHSVDEVFIENE